VAVIVRDTEAVLEGDFVDVDDLVTDAEPDIVSVLKRERVPVGVDDTVLVAEDVDERDGVALCVFEDDDDPVRVCEAPFVGDSEADDEAENEGAADALGLGELDPV
jgi:hypothetical protein